MERKSFTQWLEEKVTSEKKVSEGRDEFEKEDLGSAAVIKKPKKQKK